MIQNTDSFDALRDALKRNRREIKANIVLSRLSVLAFSILCLSLFGCTDSESQKSSSAVSDEQFAGIEIVDSATDTATAVQSSISNTAQKGGTLVIEVEECGIADPAIDVASSSKRQIFTLVKETHTGLTRIVDDPLIRAKPELSESFTVSENGTLYEFTMKKNLKFSDGSKLTASDVKWSWERALKKSTGNSRANDVFGDIIGSDAVVQGNSQDLSGVEIIDDDHLRVRLKQPRPEFPMLIADPVAYVVKREGVSEWGDAWINDPHYPSSIVHNTGIIPESLPMGAGPFKIAEYVHPEITRGEFSGEYRCVLERNNHYWDRHSYLDGVIAIVRPDLLIELDTTQNRQKKLLISGELDITMSTTDSLDQLENGIKQFRVKEPPEVSFFTLNPQQAPLDNLHLRRALAKAIDVDSAIRNVNGVPNQNRLVPKSLSIEDSDVSSPDIDIVDAKNELDTAMAQLDSELFEIALYSTYPPEFLGTKQVIFDAWRDTLGINIDIRQFDFENNIHFEDLQITEVNFTLHYPSPHGVLREFLNAMGDENIAADIEEIRAQLTAAAATLDDAERMRIYDDIERRILEDVLAIPTVVLEPYFDLLLQPWVNGLEISQYRSSVFHNVWINAEALERTSG